MSSKWKWLLLPPAVAVVLLLGPLRGPEDKHQATATGTPATVPADATNAGAPKSTAPAVPDAFAVGSALIGVLLLGGAALALFSRLRGGHAAGDKIVSLRQSLRLSPRHRLHVVELDTRLLLVGECDGNLCVLDRGDAPEAAADERTLRARAADEESLDEGATPRDLVLTPQPARRRAPTPPRTAGTALADFRALLRRARVPSGT